MLTMFESWIGKDKFRAGLRDYMRTHAWKNAEAKDFFTALSRQSSPQVIQAFQSFVDQPGVPEVSVALSCGTANTLKVQQKRYTPKGATSKAAKWDLPFCYRTPKGSNCQIVGDAVQTIDLGKVCPQWITANDGGTGYYRVSYEKKLGRNNLLNADLSSFEKVVLLNDMRAQIATGKMTRVESLQVIDDLARTTTNPQVLSELLSFLVSKERHVEEKYHANYERFIRKSFGGAAKRIGLLPKKGEDDAARALRSSLSYSVAIAGKDPEIIKQAKKLTQKWLKDHLSIPEDSVGLVTGIAAHYGDAKLFDHVLGLASKETNTKRRRRYLGILASFEDPELIKRGLEITLTDQFNYRELGFVSAGLGNKKTRKFTYDFVLNNYDGLLKKMSKRDESNMPRVGAYFCTTNEAAQLTKDLSAKMKKVDGGEKSLERVVEGIKLCEAQVGNLKPVSLFLSKY